jgi:hypothetical protein
MTASIPDLLSSGAWADVVAWLPRNLDALAASSHGFQRRRAIKTPADFIRVAMAYSVLDLSLRAVAAWCSDHSIGELSDVAVLGRLRRGWPFLKAVFEELIAAQMREAPRAGPQRRIRLIDATTLSHPGSSGADWRLHATYDPAQGVVDGVELTDGRGGEHLGRVPLRPGDLVVADRGYAHEERIREAREAGADVLVRIGHSAVPMVDKDGTVVDPLQFAVRRRSAAGRPPRAESRGVYLRSDTRRALPLRLIVVRKSREAAERDRRRIEQVARRKGKIPMARTLAACRFAFLLTSVPEAEASDATMADLYRLRWQIELTFKRWKSLLGLAGLRADDPDLARAYIYAKLIAAALADRMTRQWRAFSPYGLPVRDGDLASLAELR